MDEGGGQRQRGWEGGRAVRRAVLWGQEGEGGESDACEVHVECKARWPCFQPPQLPLHEPGRSMGKQASTLARRLWVARCGNA